jgi:hypothetical protein
MKSSAALRIAKSRIEKGLNTHVCDALRMAGYSNARTKLIGMFGSKSVASWLHERGHAESFDIHSPEMREYRLKWIDWMIEGYERVGD